MKNVPAPPWKLRGQSVAMLQRASTRSETSSRAASFVARFFAKLPRVLALVHYEDSPVGAYNECAVAILTLRGASVIEMQVDSEASLRGGRENWGYPKTLAELSWRREYSQRRKSAQNGDNALSTQSENRDALAKDRAPHVASTRDKSVNGAADANADAKKNIVAHEKRDAFTHRARRTASTRDAQTHENIVAHEVCENREMLPERKSVASNSAEQRASTRDATSEEVPLQNRANAAPQEPRASTRDDVSRVTRIEFRGANATYRARVLAAAIPFRLRAFTVQNLNGRDVRVPIALRGRARLAFCGRRVAIYADFAMVVAPPRAL